MDIVCIFLGVVFTAAGLLFALGRLHGRTAAWRAMSDEEREQLNVKALVRNVGEVIMLCGLIFLAKGAWPDFSERSFTAAMVAWLIVAGLDVLYISKSDRYRSK